MSRRSFGPSVGEQEKEHHGTFAQTYAAARESAGHRQVMVYAHRVSDVASRRRVEQRDVHINPSSHVDIRMVLNSEATSEFIGASFGAQFLPDHVVCKDGVLQITWPVGLEDAGVIVPRSDRRVEWVLRRPLILKPGQAVLLTVSPDR